MIPAGSCCEKCYNDVNPQTLLFSFVFLDAAVGGSWFIPAYLLLTNSGCIRNTCELFLKQPWIPWMLRFRMADSSGSTQQLEQRLELSPNHDSLEKKRIIQATSIVHAWGMKTNDCSGISRKKCPQKLEQHAVTKWNHITRPVKNPHESCWVTCDAADLAVT